MRYYLPVDLDEHMLYSYEIAAKFGLWSENKMLHSRFVTHLIEYVNKPMKRLYYETKHGLKPVYSLAAITKAMLWLYSQLKNNASGLHHIKIDSTTYKVRIDQAFFNTINLILSEFGEEQNDEQRL